MSNLNLSLVAGYDVDSPALRKPVSLPRPSLGGLIERLSARLLAAERRRTDAQIARMIAENGGVITDDLERRIGRQLGI